ncbi:hypothetical protein T484DRAFT_2879984 [Baffinella frigidus]|nr:hypothetical protein T484DRAFT_2879984 [Cryptophyta sp. CCMP2293]
MSLMPKIQAVETKLRGDSLEVSRGDSPEVSRGGSPEVSRGASLEEGFLRGGLSPRGGFARRGVPHKGVPIRGVVFLFSTLPSLHP